MATLHPNRFSQQLAGSPFLSQNVLSVPPCLISIFLLSNLCLSYLLFSLCLSQIKKQTSEEQFIEVPHPLIIAAHHSRAVISNHDLQMFHLGASLFATSCTDFLLPHLSYYYFLHYFNDLSVLSHSRQGNCQEIQVKQDDIQQQYRCCISCNTAEKSVVVWTKSQKW